MPDSNPTGHLDPSPANSIENVEQALRISEERLHNLLNSQTSYVLRTDLNGKYTFQNKKFLDEFGWIFRKEDTVEGDSLATIEPHHHDRAKEVVMKCLENPGVIFQVELDKRSKDNTNMTSLWEFVCLTDPVGNPTEIQCMGFDITDRKKAEEEIRQLNLTLENRIAERTKELEESNIQLELARVEAEQANLAKSEFLSRMSHELRTPLNAILGFAQLLDLANLEPKQKNGVRHIISSGNHLLGLINEILEISRIEAGHMSLNLEPVELNAMISQILDLLHPLASEKNIRIDYQDIPAPGPCLKADKQRLKQVLINIISNAIKYNRPDGSICIRILQDPTSPVDNDFIRIEISDTGIGIAPENLDKLFTPFERLGAERSNIEGTGLGLTVVKKLIGIMNGRIGVVSEPDKGSTFWIEMPVSVRSAEKIAQPAGAELSGEISSSASSGTILYFEDNAPNVALVEQILHSYRENIQLVTTKFGAQSIELALHHKPDLILMDLDLPDVHGSVVMDMIHGDDRTKHIPVVIVSANAMPHQLTRMMKSGAKHYLTKPVNVVNFLRVVDQFIHS